MVGRVILWLLVVSWCAQHVIGLKTLSKDEDMELQKMLKLHRKPVVAIIKTKYGDEFNCIDFYKQPAFDHPMLRNRISEFKMTLGSTPFQDLWASKIWVNGKGCPNGTVPIKRYTKDDLIKAIRIAKIHAFNLNLFRNISTSATNTQYHDAVAKKTGSYSGIVTRTSLWAPRVQDNEYSSAMMKISAELDEIQTGVTVNPSLFHDHRTRLFIFTVMNETFCFNDLCPGFVRDGQIPLGVPYDTSVAGHESYDTGFSVSREQRSGNWDLRIGTEEIYIRVGYWPKSVFTESGLGNLATDVEWGGEIYTQTNGDVLPEMGSGYPKFIKDSFYTAHNRGLQIPNTIGQVENAPLDMDTYADSPYRISNIFTDDEDMVSFFYGGPILE